MLCNVSRIKEVAEDNQRGSPTAGQVPSKREENMDSQNRRLTFSKGFGRRGFAPKVIPAHKVHRLHIKSKVVITAG